MDLRKNLIKISSTFFYAGFLPFVPGTFGSLAGVIVYFLVNSNNFVYWLVTSLMVVLGFLVSGPAEDIFGVKDARYIVIDEVAGMLLSLLFLPFDIKLVIIGFFIFRLMDTLKPFPAGRLQSLKGSAGVMLDDIIAAVYTNIILQVAWRLASFRAS